MKTLGYLLHSLLVFTVTFAALSSVASADEGYYPTPADFSSSVIVGKTLKNPFAARLRLNQAKVKDVMNSSKVTDNLGDQVAVGTTMYFGPSSNRNRAIIDGKVRRPGDEIEAMDRAKQELSLHLLEIRRDSVVLGLTGGDRQEAVVVFSDKRRHRAG